MQNKMKRNRWLIASLFIMGLIFSFSADHAAASDAKSSFIVDGLYPWFQGFCSIDQFTFLIRKTAHFSIYAALGVCVYQMFAADAHTRSHALLWCVLLCFLYACSDEAHQLFSKGRSGQFSDVLLDTCGSVCGAFFIRWVRQACTRKR